MILCVEVRKQGLTGEFLVNHRLFVLDFKNFHASLCFICLAESIAVVADGERAIAMGREL